MEEVPKTYLERQCTVRTHFQPFHLDNCTWAHDYILDTLHFDRKYQGKDRRICFLNKRGSGRNRYSVHILVGIQRMDHPDSLSGMYRFHFHNVHWDHKVMMRKDQPLTAPLLEKIDVCHTYFKRFTISTECYAFYFLTWCHGSRVTVAEGISGVSAEAGTYRNMIEHRALRVGTTGSRTRIPALFSHAGLTWWTVRVYCTFWTTVWWTSNVCR